MQSNTKSVVSDDILSKILIQHFGAQVQLEKSEELTDGWFNAIFVLYFKGNGVLGHKQLILKTGLEDNKYVLSYEKDLMKTELEVYELLSKKGIPIPTILVKDFSKKLVNFNYFIMEKLEGAHWDKCSPYIIAHNFDALIAEHAKYTATMHQIKGPYFGYIKDDTSFHFNTWRDAFHNMMHLLIEDGIRDNIDLPYDDILHALMPIWTLLDDIKEPSLVNFDMWKPNIMLKNNKGIYEIEAYIDHERAFYGDPYADFIALQSIIGDVSQNNLYQESYSAISGKSFNFDVHAQLRHIMYDIYLLLIMGIEIYRFDDPTVKFTQTDNSRKRIKERLLELEALKQQMN